MKKLNEKWFKSPGPPTLWSKGYAEGILPKSYRKLLTVIIPLTYFLFLLFGISSCFYPPLVFQDVVGYFYGSFWGYALTIASAISLIGIIFRLRVEIYSSIVLFFMLAMYPIYIAYTVFDDLANIDVHRIGSIFSVAIYCLLPAWRVIDIVANIRKTKQRQLYAEHALGEAQSNASSNDNSKDTN